MESSERKHEVYEFWKRNGTRKTIRKFVIKDSTLLVYIRECESESKHSHHPETQPPQQPSENIYSKNEIKAIEKSGNIDLNKDRSIKIAWHKESIKIGYITDTHIGSIYTDESIIYKAFETFDKNKIDILCHSGDVLEGMSNRPGHVYELSKIGYNEQKDNAINILKQWRGNSYYIDGNHDRWYIKSNGAIAVKDICDCLPNAHFLGHDEGDIWINDVLIRLWHGEDSSSYAHSYRLQKIIESLQGGDKPNVLLAGHTHKAMYFFDRNIHVFSGGCIQRQSKWMRSKRLAAHTGFWIIELGLTNSEITYCNNTFYPIY